MKRLLLTALCLLLAAPCFAGVVALTPDDTIRDRLKVQVDNDGETLTLRYLLTARQVAIAEGDKERVAEINAMITAIEKAVDSVKLVPVLEEKDADAK